MGHLSSLLPVLYIGMLSLSCYLSLSESLHMSLSPFLRPRAAIPYPLPIAPSRSLAAHCLS